MKRLQDRVMWVVGGGSGIGRAIAVQAAQEGARVWISGRRRRALAETVRFAGGVGRRIRQLTCDVTQPAAVKRAVATILKRDGGIDGLVISIGWAVAGTIEETSFEDWRKLSAVHLDGMFLTCREALKGLRNSGHGSIVIIGSMFGLKGKEGRLAYCTMKGGVVNFVRSLALDLAGSVRVNSICPGWVETEMSMRLVNAAEDPPAAWRDRQQWHPMGRGGKPEEVAELCVFMLSDRAGWMTGQNVALDGGATAR